MGRYYYLIPEPDPYVDWETFPTLEAERLF
jgi:hypothetical protein